MPAIEESTVEVEGLEVFCRRVGGEGVSTVFVHGNPTHSEDWLAFLERSRGPAIAFDLPGWGRTERPRHGYTMRGLASFYERTLAALGVERHKLCAHDWGAVALIAEQRRPELLERLAILNAVPLLPGYRWHWVARLWRRRGIGELANMTSTRFGTGLTLRQAKGDRGRWPEEFVDMIYDHLDSGAKRAILTLYRSAPESALAAAGAGLERLACPSLVVWGDRDPYLPLEMGRAYAQRLPAAELEIVPGGGHWPWRDDPAVVERVLAFLEPD